MSTSTRQRAAGAGWKAALAALICAVLPLSAAQRKVTVHAFDALGDDVADIADRATQRMIELLAEVPETIVSRVRPAPGAIDAHARLSAGELGRKVADATGAEVVILGAVVRPAEAPDVLLATMAAFDATSSEVALLSPVRFERSQPTGPTVDFERAVAEQAVRWYRSHLAPTGELLGVRAEDGGVELELRLDGPLARSDSGYLLVRLADAKVSDDTGERFAESSPLLGRVRLSRSGGAVAWFQVDHELSVNVHDRLRIQPASALGAVTEEPGVVITSRPRGALVTIGSRSYGTTPLRVPTADVAEAEIQLTRFDATPYQQRLADTERAEGLLAVLLVQPQEPGTPPAPAPQVQPVAPARPPIAPAVPELHPPAAHRPAPTDVPPVTDSRSPAAELPKPAVSESAPTQVPMVQGTRAQPPGGGPISFAGLLDAAGASGVLTLESEPSGAEVWIAGQSRGVTPLRVDGVSGRLAIRLALTGYQPWEAEVWATGSLLMRAQLDPLGAGVGSLQVVSSPAGAVVFVDGQERGFTPLEIGDLASGPHEVKLVCQGEERLLREVNVPAHETSRLEVRFAAVVTEATQVTTRPLGPPQMAIDELSRLPLDTRRMVWERKVVLGQTADGKLVQIHIAVCKLERGTLVSITISPSSKREVVSADGELIIEFPDAATQQAWKQKVQRAPELLGVEIVPGEAGKPPKVRLQLAEGVVAGIHESSTADRLRIVLMPPTGAE